VQSISPSDPAARARAALRHDAAAACAASLGRVAGTHALLLDQAGAEPPVLPGIACWTVLRPAAGGSGWQGALRAESDALPFGDDSFCAVLLRFAGAVGVVPEAVAGELSRVLAPHGVLLVVDLHTASLWPGDGMSPRRWERALRNADLDVGPATRCGSPWPRARGAEGLPHWLVRAVGGAYVIEAHRRKSAAIPLRKAAERRRKVEHGAFVPGTRRQCA
jgi:SAM-dependent methyltransferase